MRVEIRILEEAQEPCAILCTRELTEEMVQLAELLKRVPEGYTVEELQNALQAVRTAEQDVEQITDRTAQTMGRAAVLTVQEEERMVVLHPEEIYLIRVEQEKTVVYGKTKSYISRKRLYELEQYLGNGFMRISKSALVNLQYLDYVEASFHGMMLLKLKNQNQEYVSRKYLPHLKQYLGL